jgi:hypothetical protein
MNSTSVRAATWLCLLELVVLSAQGTLVAEQDLARIARSVVDEMP